jgi:hypothetical protein
LRKLVSISACQPFVLAHSRFHILRLVDDLARHSNLMFATINVSE